MNPLPDRVVIVALLATLGLVFALIFWTVRLSPSPQPLQWRQPVRQAPSSQAPLSAAPRWPSAGTQL